jgi:hypothetical protein
MRNSGTVFVGRGGMQVGAEGLATRLHDERAAPKVVRAPTRRPAVGTISHRTHGRRPRWPLPAGVTAPGAIDD